MKLPFAIPDRAIRGNFDALVERVTDLLGLGLTKRTSGTVNVSTVAAVSGSAVVTHGLGATPSVILATANNDASVTNCGAVTIGATQFTVGIRFTDGVARTTTIVVGWEAIA